MPIRWSKTSVTSNHRFSLNKASKPVTFTMFHESSWRPMPQKTSLSFGSEYIFQTSSLPKMTTAHVILGSDPPPPHLTTTIWCSNSGYFCWALVVALQQQIRGNPPICSPASFCLVSIFLFDRASIKWKVYFRQSMNEWFGKILVAFHMFSCIQWFCPHILGRYTLQKLWRWRGIGGPSSRGPCGSEILNVYTLVN